MKKEQTLFLIVLFAACQAVAQQPSNIKSAASHTNAPSASATDEIVKPEFHWLGPPNPAQTETGPRMIEGLDTRAWTTVVEDDSGKSVFPDAETHEGGLCLFWWGSEPRRQ